MSEQTGGAMQDPRAEKLMEKLLSLKESTSLQVLEQEIKELESISESLQKELKELQMQATQLEGICKEKEELCQLLQLQFEECEQESASQAEQNKKSEEMLRQYSCEIQEYKLKQHKQRMKFENNINQLIEQHKRLYSIFTPERLPAEIVTAENTKQQLLQAEEKKLVQLRDLEENIEEMKKQQLRVTTEAQEEELVI